MSKTSNPVVKDGLGIVARLVIIAALLSMLGSFLQGCAGKSESREVNSRFQSFYDPISEIQPALKVERQKVTSAFYYFAV